MKKLILVVFLTVLASISGYSQNIFVDTSVTAANIPDSVNYNANIGHTVVVQIQGGTPFTGLIHVVAGVDSTGGLLSIDTVASRSVVNKLNDTINFQVTETYNNINGYRMGGNVVVIWPVANTLTTVDSLETDVFVMSPASVNDKSLYRALKIYPNPSNNFIYFDLQAQQLEIKHVRIYTANGLLIYNEKFYPKINISNFPRGMYFIKVGLKEEELHYKLIKD